MQPNCKQLSISQPLIPHFKKVGLDAQPALRSLDSKRPIKTKFGEAHLSLKLTQNTERKAKSIIFQILNMIQAIFSAVVVCLALTPADSQMGFGFPHLFHGHGGFSPYAGFGNQFSSQQQQQDVLTCISSNPQDPSSFIRCVIYPRFIYCTSLWCAVLNV